MATGFQIDFDVDAAHFNALLAELHLKVSPAGLTTFLNTIVDPFIRSRIDERFASEGDDVTGAWSPLTVATAMIRASQGISPDHPINVRTSKMRDYLVNTQSDVKPTGFDAVLSHPPPTGDAKLNEKIKTAQMGSTSPRTPPRPVIGLNQNDLLFVTSELVIYLVP